MRKVQPWSSTSGIPNLRIVSVMPGSMVWYDFRMLEGNGEQISLENTKHDRRIAGVLHDLLPAAVLSRQSAELRNHRREQLQHDRRADVRHDAEGKNRAILQRAAAEKIKERRDAAASLFRGDVRNHSCNTAWLTPGVVIAAPRRTITMTARVNRIRRRSSGILTVFRNAETIS